MTLHCSNWRQPKVVDFGYLPLDKQSNYNVFQLIHSMYEYRSLIITTNKDFTQWGDFFCDNNIAVPIIDRIIHHAQIFMLGGESYRLKNSLNAQKKFTQGGSKLMSESGSILMAIENLNP